VRRSYRQSSFHPPTSITASLGLTFLSSLLHFSHPLIWNISAFWVFYLSRQLLSVSSCSSLLSCLPLYSSGLYSLLVSSAEVSKSLGLSSFLKSLLLYVFIFSWPPPVSRWYARGCWAWLLAANGQLSNFFFSSPPYPRYLISSSLSMIVLFKWVFSQPLIVDPHFSLFWPSSFCPPPLLFSPLLLAYRISFSFAFILQDATMSQGRI
jgi:hypothetical protein